MAVVEITTPPILIADAVQYFTSGNSFIGPWLIGADLYCVLETVSSGVILHVYKSIDGGSTWTAQDDGNSAEFFVAGQQSVFEADRITLFFNNVSAAAASDAYPFDIATDLYTALISAVESPGNAPAGARAQARSDGTIIDLYFQDQISAGSGVVTLGRILSGAYGARFIVDSETGGGAQSVIAKGLIVDSSDVTHVLTRYINDAVTIQDTRYLTIDAGNTVSAPVTIDSDPDHSTLCDQPVSFYGNLAFPFLDPGSGFFRAKIHYATGATSNPASATWSVVDTWTTGLNASSNDVAQFAILDTNGDLLVFWINTPPVGTFKVYYARFNGATFDAPVVFYDPLLYPPAGSTQDATFAFGGLSIAIVGGQFVGIIGMDIDGTGDQTFYLTNGGAPVSSGYFHAMY